MKLVLFEDTEEQANPLKAAIEAELGAEGEVVRYVPQDGDDARIYEVRLAEDLTSGRYSGAALVIADRDLSKMPGYRGLSEPTVRRVVDELAIPECSYSRNAQESDFPDSTEQRQVSIAVSIADGEKDCARQVVEIARGFVAIQGRLQHLVDEGRLATISTPGILLAAMLEKPEYADKISLYASGDLNRLSGAFSFRKAVTNERKVERLSCLLGYWLWHSVLHYPGVVVNSVAASSYLNIREDQFRNDPMVRGLFESAKYIGPFAEAKGDLWWRGMLDDVVAGADCADGRDFASKRLKRDVPRSECCEDNKRSAGYYCMITKRPVSLANSKGNLPWFPRGADLARVSIREYEELGPWL
jgi:hypothetical protein